MDGIAELPAVSPTKKRLPHQFTRENAVEMQRRAAAAQQLRLDREKAEAEATKANPQTTTQRHAKDRSDIVAEQIVRTRKELNKDQLYPRIFSCMTPHSAPSRLSPPERNNT